MLQIITAVADKIGPIIGQSCVPSRQKITTQMKQNSTGIKVAERKWFQQYNEENPASPLHFIIDIGSNPYMKCIIISIQVQYIDRSSIGFPRKIKTVALEVIEALPEEEFIKHLIKKWDGKGNITDKINIFMNKVNKQWLKERQQNIRKKKKAKDKKNQKILAAALKIQQKEQDPNRNRNINESREQSIAAMQDDETTNTTNVLPNITNPPISSSTTSTNIDNETESGTNETATATTNTANPLKHTASQPPINTGNLQLSQTQDVENDSKMSELKEQDETSETQDIDVDDVFDLTQMEEIDLIQELSQTNLIDDKQDKIENVPSLSQVILNQPLRINKEYIDKLQQELTNKSDNDSSSDDVIWPGSSLSDSEFTSLQGESVYIEDYDSFIPDNWTINKFYDSRINKATQWFVPKKNKSKMKEITSKASTATGLTKPVWRYVNAEQIKALQIRREELRKLGKSLSASQAAKQFPMDDFFATNCTSDAGM